MESPVALRDRGDARSAWGLCLPGVVWLGIFLLLPLVATLSMSFLTRDELGEAGLPLSWDAYLRFFGFGTLGFDPLYPVIFLRTLILALAATALSVAAALPLAFFIASLPSRWKSPVLMLVVIPLWTNLVVRTYAWQMLLGPGGALAGWARALGWVGPGEGLYPGTVAVMTGLVCDYLPFLVLPLYASVERIQWSLVEAARDLGARRWDVFRHAILPQIRPGLSAGIWLTFIPALGQFLVPDLLGGGKTVLLGNVIQQQFGASSDWPFGAAITVMTFGMFLAVMAAVAIRREGRG